MKTADIKKRIKEEKQAYKKKAERELSKWAHLYNKAIKKQWLLVKIEPYKDNYEYVKIVDPYPVFFTPKKWKKEIEKGHWHYCNWDIITPEKVRIELTKRILELQQRINQTYEKQPEYKNQH